MQLFALGHGAAVKACGTLLVQAGQRKMAFEAQRVAQIAVGSEKLSFFGLGARCSSSMSWP